MLTIVSFILYYSLEPTFAVALALLILANYYFGLGLEHCTRRRLLFGLSLGLNFGLLGTLKYAAFFRDNLQMLLSFTSFQLPEVPVWLPVGISFFIFQIQSYIFDVYYRVIPAETSLLRFSLFVSFFPQLVAGPIVKARHFLPQLLKRTHVTWEDVHMGIWNISTGLVLKVVVADNLAHYTLALKEPMVDVRHSLNLVVLSWAFMVQVFGDFAGYTSIAIGLARICGYQLPINFNAPFLALGFNDFWKRWHISLTHWFKDYVFLRLAMGSVWKGKMYRCLVLTFLASGLWHGATWTYVIWGGLHGLGCVIDSVFSRAQGPHFKWRWWQALAMWGITFQSVCFLGIFFYHQKCASAFHYFQQLFGPGWQQPLILPVMADVIFFMLPVLILHLVALSKTAQQWISLPWIRSLCIGLNLVLLCGLWAEQRGFIYFAF